MKKVVYIIDDDFIYRMIASKMIGFVNSKQLIIECENGIDGLEKLQRITNAEDEIIVLLDINMPILDGWGVLMELEKTNFYNILNFRIHIVSSSTDESDIIKSKQFKFLGRFLHKPLSKEDIEMILGNDMAV